MSVEANGRQKWVLTLVGMILLAAVVVVALVREAIVRDRYYQVSISGNGTVEYVPDLAKVTIGVQIDRASTAESALTQLTERMDKVTKAIIALGIEESEIKSQNYSLTPVYDYIEGQGSIVGGYNANQQIVVWIGGVNDKNKDLVSKVVTETTKVGSNQIMGIEFSAWNIDELKNEARLKALVDAKGRASHVSGEMGVRLGRIVGWWDNVTQAPGINYYGGYEYGGMAQSLDGKGTVSPGTQEIKAEANVNYELRRF